MNPNSRMIAVTYVRTVKMEGTMIDTEKYSEAEISTEYVRQFGKPGTDLEYSDRRYHIYQRPSVLSSLREQKRREKATRVFDNEALAAEEAKEKMWILSQYFCHISFHWGWGNGIAEYKITAQDTHDDGDTEKYYFRYPYGDKYVGHL